MRNLPATFDYERSETLDEALALLQEHGADANVIAGGTDLVIKIAEKEIRPKKLIDIGRITDLERLFEAGDFIHIGALTTFHTLENSRLIKEKIPILRIAAANMGNPQVRNRATIGGNLANASPAADSAPPLLALGGEVVLNSKAGERVVPITDFFLDVEKTVLKADELITEIRIPLQGSNGSSGIFIKLGKRKAASLSIVSTAIVLAHSNGICAKARIAMGAVAPTPIRAKKTEDFLKGKKLTEQVIQKAAELAAGETAPVSDNRASQQYRKEMSKVLVRQGIEQALQF